MNDKTQGRSMMIRTAAAVLCGMATVAVANESGDKFKTMDTNNDGMISAQEHAAGVTKMFAEMDANHDGNVTAAEMDAGHHMMKGMAKHEGTRTMNDAAMDQGEMHRQMSSTDKIAKMDTNGDGVLSAAEHDAGAQAMFSEMDTDGNGSLSRQEMAAGHAMMKSGKKPAEKTP
jgi:Ca2+-binding EF-hand superfamily protein